MTVPMHVVINPTWRCQLACAYCWRAATGHDRATPERAWQDWAEGLVQALPAGSMVDIAGGEPLLFPGVLDLGDYLGRAGLRWAMTTNAVCETAIDDIARRRPAGLALVLVSAHAGNPDWPRAVALLRGVGITVDVNQVGHPAAAAVEGRRNVIPYQDWLGGKALDNKVRICDAGQLHWAADPEGNVYRCMVRLQVHTAPMGNVLDGPLPEVKPVRCDLGCSTCYTDHPEAWCVHWREGAA